MSWLSTRLVTPLAMHDADGENPSVLGPPRPKPGPLPISGVREETSPRAEHMSYEATADASSMSVC